MPSDRGPLDPMNGSVPRIEIDGLVASEVVHPDRPEEVADILADAHRLKRAVSPIGGGTSLSLGNPPDQFDIALVTDRLRGIIEYAPTDLTLSVAAGSPFADVQAVLAEHGQTLPIEVPGGDRPTIGGLIATALAGPRRLGSGTLRDLLIGIAAAHPSGTVTKAGGLVVKNVTGFDLMRLYHGSLGTLGVIVSANFKVLPLPRYEATIHAQFNGAPLALNAAERLRSSRVGPVALEVSRRGSDPWLLSARIEGREATVGLLTRETRALIPESTGVLKEQESRDWWRSYVESQRIETQPQRAMVRCTVRPKAIGHLVEQIDQTSTERGVSVESWMISPGLGSVLIVITCQDGARFMQFRTRLLDIADHAVTLAAPLEWKRGMDVWGREPDGVGVMRAVKQEFDPDRVLNPGRFISGI